MPALVIAFLILLADQVTKVAVRVHFLPGESVGVIDGLFSLTYVRNTGAAWGMFGGQNFLLSILSIVMLVLMVVFQKAVTGGDRRILYCLGLLAGGILGNLVDRLKLGYVTDFLDFYVATHHWPVFNIADSAICVGVGLYMIFTLRPSAASSSSPVAT